MQWYTSFFVLLSTCHFSTTKTTGTFNFNTLGTHSHCRRQSSFHCSSKRYTSLKLLSNVLSYQASIQLRPLDFTNINLNFFTCDFLQLLTKKLNLLTAFTDNYTGSGRIQSQQYSFGCSLNYDV